MNIHEHQAKALLSGFGVPVPRGEAVTVLPNRPAVTGRDAVEAVVIYLALGGSLLAWGLYALRRARR